MPFTAPMLASPLPKNFNPTHGQYVAEEKFDGHRIVLEVEDGKSNLFDHKRMTAWSRHGLERLLPSHLQESLSHLPRGIYDGELLVPGKRSYGVTELTNTGELAYFVFDIIQLLDTDTTPLTYDDRRSLLEEMELRGAITGSVKLATSIKVNSWEAIVEQRDSVWARDGEGLILKRRAAPYQIAKRSKDFIKIKQLRTAVLTVIGFSASRGQINDRGPFAMTEIEDEDGNVTTVKTRNDAICRELESKIFVNGRHPYIGRKLRIEFQERTPDGSYRHPRWDRWEDE